METLLERATALLTAGSAPLVALSVSHEFGYFSYTGLFYQAFVSATDYLTNAILWMPIATVTVIGWKNWDFIWKDPPKIRRNEWRTWIAPSFIVGLPTCIYIFASEGFPIFYLAMLVYLWVVFFDFIIPAPAQDATLSTELRRLFKIAVPVCAALFTTGYQSAKTDLASKTNPYVVQMKDAPSASLKIPLRNFDKGVLFNDPIAGRIEFIKWDRIESVAKPHSQVKGAAPLSCSWLGWLCPTPGSSP